MTPNAFTHKFDCWITGKLPAPAPKRKYIKVAERHAASVAERTAKMLAFVDGGINIPPQADSDRRASFKKAAI